MKPQMSYDILGEVAIMASNICALCHPTKKQAVVIWKGYSLCEEHLKEEVRK